MTESVIKEELYNQERLAVALGWTSIDANGLTGIPPGERLLKLIPRWYSDLNAAHELGEYFAGRGWKAADDYLCALAKQVGTWDKWAPVQATASQRAEAALEVLLRMAEQKEEN